MYRDKDESTTTPPDDGPPQPLAIQELYANALYRGGAGEPGWVPGGLEGYQVYAHLKGLGYTVFPWSEHPLGGLPPSRGREGLCVEVTPSSWPKGLGAWRALVHPLLAWVARPLLQGLAALRAHWLPGRLWFSTHGKCA